MSVSTKRSDARLLAAFRDLVMEGWLLQKQAVQAEHLSMVQFMLLRHVAAREPSHPSELAEAFGVTPSGITLLLRGLETRGWVRRSHASEDRRTVLVALTPVARKALAAVDTQRERVTAAALAPLSTDQRSGMTEVLEAMAERMRVERARIQPRRRARRAP